MTDAEMRVALKQLRWSQSALAERLRVSEQAVSAWSTGKVDVPGPVAAFLRLAVAVRAMAEVVS